MSAQAAAALWQREIVRFLRQPSRILSAVGSPIVFWLLIGTGLSASFRLPSGPPDVDYFEYFFPGTIVLLVMFGSIFSTISVIEDRQQGFLQGVLAAPIGSSSLVLGKVLGGATLAWLQGVVLLALAPTAGIGLTFEAFVAATGVLALLALGMTAVGFPFAWKLDTTQGFHAVMNLILIPMWLLSGAFFPADGAAGWLGWVMRLNPMTYGVAAFRRALYLGDPTPIQAVPEAGLSLGILLAWCVLALAIGVGVVRRGSES